MRGFFPSSFPFAVRFLYSFFLSFLPVFSLLERTPISLGLVLDQFWPSNINSCIFPSFSASSPSWIVPSVHHRPNLWSFQERRSQTSICSSPSDLGRNAPLLQLHWQSNFLATSSAPILGLHAPVRGSHAPVCGSHLPASGIDAA